MVQLYKKSTSLNQNLDFLNHWSQVFFSLLAQTKTSNHQNKARNFLFTTTMHKVQPKKKGVKP